MMVRCSPIFLLAAVLFAGFSGATAHASGLSGSSVTLSGACCDFVTDVSSTAGPVTVGPGLEFNSSALQFYTEQYDVSANQIIITTENVKLGSNYSDGGFNGFIFNFAGAPPIFSVLVDGASTLDPVSLSFTGSQIDVNFAGLAAPTGSTTILDVTTTPEPSSLVLLGTGLAGLTGVARRRFRRS